MGWDGDESSHDQEYMKKDEAVIGFDGDEDYDKKEDDEEEVDPENLPRP